MTVFTARPEYSVGQLAVLVVRDYRPTARSLTALADEHNLSRTSVICAATVWRTPSLAEAVLNGELSLQAAYDRSRKRKVSPTLLDRTTAGRQMRDARIREMAAEGFSEIDIADAVGLSVGGLHNIMNTRLHIPTLSRKLGINARLDADRVMESLVQAAQPSEAALSAIDWDGLDLDRLAGWAEALTEAIGAWTALRNQIRREMRA